MDLDYHQDRDQRPDQLREATPEDDRFALRVITAIAVLTVAILLLIWVTGDTLETVPPA